jgi:LmbE family N-acetylglucosaminyl deacetylase
MAAGEATTRALYPAVRNPYAYPELRNDEGLEAWTVSWLWLMAVEKPNLFIDVTDKFELKLAALREHDSQVAHMDNLDELITGWLTMQAEAAGFEAGRLAEAFRQVKLPD